MTRLLMTAGGATLLAFLCGGCPTDSAGVVSLTAGSYTGDITSVVNVYTDGVVSQQFSNTLRITETINSAGLPVLSTGQGAKSGDALVLASAGQDFLIGMIDSVVPSDNRLVLNFTLSGSMAGLTVAGTGQTTYTASGANAIDFSLSLDFYGVNAQSQTIRQQEIQTGRLTR